MTEQMLLLIESIGTPLITGLLLAYFNKKSIKRYDDMEVRAERRKRESMITMELAEANAKLSYACAMALQRGSTNGEVEDGIKAYKKAIKAQEDFRKELHTEVINER